MHSNAGSVSSPLDSFDFLLSAPTTTPTNSNDLNSLLSSPSNPQTSSQFLPNNDIYTTLSSSKSALTSSISAHNQSRSSTRLRQLLANKSPSMNDHPSQTLHYHPEGKVADPKQEPESPPTAHLSPAYTELPLSKKWQSQNGSNVNEQTNTSAMLLKKILGKQSSLSTSLSKTESICNDDSLSNEQSTTKQRSDIFLRV